MKVYILIVDCIDDCEKDFRVKAFRDKADAVSNLVEETSYYRECDIENEWESDGDDDCGYFTYELGYEMSNHHYIYIKEQEI